MHVLIVDDNKIMRHIIKRSLGKAGLGDIEFQEACNGLEALSSFNQKKPDLILSDWNMPEMDGMDLLKAIRSEDPHIPFGFITAQSTTALRESARYYGAHFLLSKPFTPESLSAAVHSIFPPRKNK